jgi:hypothetical protein
MIMKKLIVLLPLVLLMGCAGKTRLVPQAYMPEPPEILMKAPKELNTIKVNKTSVIITNNTEKGEPK